MPMNTDYQHPEPPRSQIDALKGPVVLEFGVPWCPHCQAAQPRIAAAFAKHPHVQHIKIEDGKGLRLGRSFQVKLWPTLVFMKDGQEVERLIRPSEVSAISDALAEIDAPERRES